MDWTGGNGIPAWAAGDCRSNSTPTFGVFRRPIRDSPRRESWPNFVDLQDPAALEEKCPNCRTKRSTRRANIERNQHDPILRTFLVSRGISDCRRPRSSVQRKRPMVMVRWLVWLDLHGWILSLLIRLLPLLSWLLSLFSRVRPVLHGLLRWQLLPDAVVLRGALVLHIGM
jgi:hypothetical protein